MSFFSSKSSPPPEAYRSYLDTSGELSSKELGYGLWWVTHKADLYNVTVFLLGLATVLTWGYALYRGALNGWYTLRIEPLIVADVVRGTNYTTLDARFSPAPLQIIASDVLPGGVNKYDLVSEIVNPNPRYRVEFEYVFETGSGTTPPQKTVLLPGEQRPVAYLGYEGEVTGGVQLTLRSVRWTRIPNRQIALPLEYQNNRLLFSVQDFNFVRAEAVPGITAHSIAFSITNGSPFSYKNALFYVGLYVADSLVGILPLEVKNFRSLETRAVDMRSFVTNLNVTDVRVFPRINVYDADVYLKPGE